MILVIKILKCTGELALYKKRVLEGKIGVSPGTWNKDRQHKQEIGVIPPDAFCFLYEA